MAAPTYGFHPIERETFYENMDFRLSRVELVGKTIDQASSAFLYFMGVDVTNERPDNDVRALEPYTGTVCGRGKVDLKSCERSIKNGMYIVTFDGDAPSPAGIVKTEFQALIDQQGSIQRAEGLNLAAGYFTDIDPNPILSRSSLDMMLLEIDDWKSNQ